MSGILDDDILSVTIVKPSWECPICCTNPSAAIYVPHCGHAICKPCHMRLRYDNCPQCRASVQYVYVHRLKRSIGKKKSVEVHLQFDEEEEPDATWTCNQCMNKRSKAFSCDNHDCYSDSLRCSDCWKRSDLKCTFCFVGRMADDTIFLQ